MMNLSGDNIYLFACSTSREELDRWIDQVKQQAIKSGIEFKGPHKPPIENIGDSHYHRRSIEFNADSRVKNAISIEHPDWVFTKIIVDESIDMFNYGVENIVPKSELYTDETTESENEESVNENTAAIDGSPVGDEESKPKVEKQVNQDNKELRKRAEKEAEPVVDNYETSTSTTQYRRSGAVREYVMARAEGHCEGCTEQAPFINNEGKPYLHAHHVHELSDGGSDTPETVIALCPNCHYRVHHGQDGEEYNRDLIHKLQQLEG